MIDTIIEQEVLKEESRKRNFAYVVAVLHASTEYTAMDGGLNYEQLWNLFIEREQSKLLRIEEATDGIVLYRDSNWDEDIHSVSINNLEDAFKAKLAIQKLIFRLQVRKER